MSLEKRNSGGAGAEQSPEWRYDENRCKAVKGGRFLESGRFPNVYGICAGAVYDISGNKKLPAYFLRLCVFQLETF